MPYRVEVGAYVAAKIASSYGPDRSPAGDPSRDDFVGGPLANATDRFTNFDRLPPVMGPAVRVATVVDPAFGAVTFTGMLVGTAAVEVVDFVADPDYRSTIDDDSDD